MFVYIVTVHLYELLEDGCLAPSAFDCEANGIVEVAIDLTGMLVVRILRPKNDRTDRAREVLHMKFHVWNRHFSSFSLKEKEAHLKR